MSKIKEFEEKAAKNRLVINCQEQIDATIYTKELMKDKPYTSNGTERDTKYITELLERESVLEVARDTQAKSIKSKECMLKSFDELVLEQEREIKKLKSQVDTLISTLGRV